MDIQIKQAVYPIVANFALFFRFYTYRITENEEYTRVLKVLCCVFCIKPRVYVKFVRKTRFWKLSLKQSGSEIDYKTE